MEHDEPGAVGTDPGLVLPARIAHWAAAEPERPFLTEVGGRSVTYGAFHRELRSWCRWLRDIGVEPGECVGSSSRPRSTPT